MFKYEDFRKFLLKDNPTYERVLTSDLHDLVAILKKPSAPSASDVAKQMSKIKKDKWKKYKNSLAYIYKSYPQLKPTLINFKTKSLSGQGGGQIRHVLSWESSSGSLADLDDFRVREHITWKAPDSISKEYTISEYQSSGSHYGMGNSAMTAGPTGSGDDTHSAVGPFNGKIVGFKGPGKLTFVVDQVYEVSDDNGTSWSPLPHSNYRILREVELKNNKICITITKSGGSGEKCVNQVEIPL